MTTLQQIYEKADAYAVSRMFYSLLRPDGEGDIFPQSSVNRPHYEESEIPELPKCYPDGLRHILHNLVLDDPVQRMSERRAMLWYETLYLIINSIHITCIFQTLNLRLVFDVEKSS